MRASTSSTLGGCASDDDASCARVVAPTELELWPLPASLRWEGAEGQTMDDPGENGPDGGPRAGVITVARDFRFVVAPPRAPFPTDEGVDPARAAADERALLAKALERACSHLSLPPPAATAPAQPLRALRVEVELAAAPLQLRALDESYALDLPAPDAPRESGAPNAPVARLRARTAHGALCGVETFAQLFPARAPALAARARAARLAVDDAPHVRWRGLLVDVARHYLPPALLRATVDAMAAVKLNTLHLHLTDSQAFPLALDEPDGGAAAGRVDASELARRGAHAYPAETYSDAELRALVAHARARGVRVVPEIDVPAHTRAWGAAFPEILVACPRHAATRENPSDVPALDPSAARTCARARAAPRVLSRRRAALSSALRHLAEPRSLPLLCGDAATPSSTRSCATSRASSPTSSCTLGPTRCARRVCWLPDGS